MCTVSIIPLRYARRRGQEPVHGFRLVTNRDEQRSRTAALPPRWHLTDTPGEGGACVRALFPTDSVGGRGGTWIGVTERGLALCLLNGNPRPYPPLPPAERLVSRGVIVPRLAARAADASTAARAVEHLDLDVFAPFTLLAVDLRGPGGADGGAGGRGGEPRVFRVEWDRRDVRRSEYASMPVCAVSSGLGDSLVQPRIALFDQLVTAEGARPEVQDRFHRHVWRGRPEISVMMSRADARTVSVTTVEVVAASPTTPARVTMRYQPIMETGELGDPVVHRTGPAGASGVGAPVIAG